MSINALIHENVKNAKYWEHVFTPDQQTHNFTYTGPTYFPFDIEVNLDKQETEREIYERILHDLVEYDYDFDPEYHAGTLWHAGQTKQVQQYSLRDLLANFDHIDKAIDDLIDNIREIINDNPDFRDCTWWDIIPLLL